MARSGSSRIALVLSWVLFLHAGLPATLLSGEIRGRVQLEGQPPRPAARATIVLSSKPRYEYGVKDAVATDEDGRYVIKDVEPGRYHVWVGTDGFFGPGGNVTPDARFARFASPPTVTVEVVGDDARTVDFTLQRGATVTARVLSEDGRAFPWIIQGFRPGLDTASEYNKDTGRLTLSCIPPGGNLVLHLIPKDDGLRYLYTRIMHLEGKSLQPGKTLDLGDIRFQPKPQAINFRGRFLNADGKAAAGIKISSVISQKGDTEFVVGAENGTFAESLFPGVYTARSVGPEADLARVVIKESGVTEQDITMRDPAPAGKKPEGTKP